ncbi:MAG: LVIVD repeat-containing protein [Gemmatimonadota bacterium]
MLSWHRIPLVLVALFALAIPVFAWAQEMPEIPAGFTGYVISGPGINAPPLPFRIEGDRMVSPEGPGIVTITESHLTADRLSMTIQTPQGPARYVAVREGDAFAGLLFIENDGDGGREVAPVTMVPMGQETSLKPDLAVFASAPGISRVEIVPGGVTLASGEHRTFVARAYDEAGAEIASPDVQWYSMGGQMSPAGEFFGINAGERTLLALVNGAIGTTTVTVLKPTISSLSVFTKVPSQLAVGSHVPLEFHGLNSAHRWEFEPEVAIVSSAPNVIAVDGKHLVARAAGRATVTLTADQATESYTIEVVPAVGQLTITGAPSAPIRTGDVVALGTGVRRAWPIWSVAGAGAQIFSNGDFVAEKAGRYTVLATLGDDVATTSIEVEARDVKGLVHIVGHGRNTSMYTADIWPQNGFVYLGTHMSNQIRTYNVSDPANPVLTDSIEVDARVINSVKVTEDGKWLAATREGATTRRNGILFYSLEDPAHPRLVSEFTESLTSGVHNVFWVGKLIYATNDGTGDMNIIDVSDPEHPKEIGRWGLPVIGKSLHDVWVQDGILYMSYMMDGLVILDVGGAGKGGTPEKPVMVSRIFYPDGPTHNAMRMGNYVFLGDEDFSLEGTVPSLPGISGAAPRGEVHVIDVTDLENPVYAARYEVPDAGAHNFWIRDEKMYIGYYQGGIRVVDIGGKLRGDLFRQGREIAQFLPQAGPADAKQPYSPMVWGVYPMFENGWKDTGGMLFATDYNSGLWSFTVELPEEEKPIS